MKKPVFTFGRMVVDKRHQFFGKSDPSVFVIADMWVDETEDDGHGEIMVDHYRGHFRIDIQDLLNKDFYEPLGMADLASHITVRAQCKLQEDKIRSAGSVVQ